MKGDMLLDSAVFQLTPTRTRFELVISSGGVTEKLASGLLKPFLLHLKAAEEQIAKGGYSIVLEVSSGHERSWFTKGTIERFVRFVSTPEVLERITAIETEIVQIEESISAQCNEASLAAADKPLKPSANGSTEANKMMVDSNLERAIVPFKVYSMQSKRESVNDTVPIQGENSRVQLFKILENRKTVLQKEQGMAYARAAAAGFDNEHMADLVSFAEYFGALRLRKACSNIMEMYKRKQEAGLWLEEMEMAATDTSALSEISFVGGSGIMLNSNTFCESNIPAACDQPGANGNYSNLSPYREPDNGLSTTEQVPTGITGGNGYLQGNIQQATMAAWPGQPPQNFQPYIVGPGPPMQGFHGLPMQGIQNGSPYYQSYPGNPYWPQVIENPIFGSSQRTESHGRSNNSAGSKHYATEEAEVLSPKSVSLSQGFIDQGVNSEIEKESVVQHPKSSRRRSSHRSENKRSGMVVIRNINYITSKGHDGISEESEPESDSDSEDEIELSDKKHKRAVGLSRKKGSRYHFADTCNSNEKDGKYKVRPNIGGGEDDNSSWQVFQTCLLKDNESSQNKVKNDNNGATQSNVQASLEPEMGVNVKEFLTTENTSFHMLSELEASNGKPMPEIQSTMSKEELLLPQRASSTWDEKHAVMSAEREELFIYKKPVIDDSIVVSEQHSEIKLAHTVSQWDTGDNIEHTIDRNGNHLHTGEHYGRCLVDDSFMVSARSAQQEQANIEWKTQINLDSELPPIEKGEHSSNDVPTNKSENSIRWEQADLLMMPERNSERYSLGQSWNPAIDNEIQDLVNIADKKYPDADLNADVGEKGILQIKANVNELPEMKITSKEGQLKPTDEALVKRKSDTAARSGKQTKLSPLTEAQLRAEKLRAFKADLQKAKKEKEEEERRRIEELKLQRQKRIAGRTNKIPNRSTSNSRSSQQHTVKPTTPVKLSVSLQKVRTSSNLSTANSLPRPITKITNEAIKRLSLHKSKASNHSGDHLNSSVSSRLVLRKENSNVSRQLRSVVQAKQITSNIKKSSKQTIPTKVGISGNLKANSALPVSSKNATEVSTDKADQLKSNGLDVSRKENKENGSISDVKKNRNKGVTLQQGTENGKSKINGTVSHSTCHVSDKSDLKKKSAVTRKGPQPISESKEESVKVHLDLNNKKKSHPNNVCKQALPIGGGNNLEDVEYIMSEENMDAVKKHNSNSKLQIQENAQSLKSDSSKATEIKDQVKASVSDDDFRKEEDNVTNSGNFSAQESTNSISTFTKVKQSGGSDPTTEEDLNDDGFELIKVSEVLSTPLNEEAMLGFPSSKKLANQRNISEVSSFVLERCSPEVPDRAPTAPVLSLDNSPAESFKFCTSSAPATPENGIASEVFTPRLNVFGYSDPHVIASDSPSASPDLHSAPKSPPSNSPAADNGKSESLPSRKRWGNSENGVKGLRRFLMFGRKSRNSVSTSADAQGDQHGV